MSWWRKEPGHHHLWFSSWWENTTVNIWDVFYGNPVLRPSKQMYAMSDDNMFYRRMGISLVGRVHIFLTSVDNGRNGSQIWKHTLEQRYASIPERNGSSLSMLSGLNGGLFLIVPIWKNLSEIWWFYASPGHQHPLYRLCRMNKFLTYMRNYCNNPCHVSVEKLKKL